MSDRAGRSSSWCACRANSAAEIATGKEARRISKIGTFYTSVEETLAENGFRAQREAGAPRLSAQSGLKP